MTVPITPLIFTLKSCQFILTLETGSMHDHDHNCSASLAVTTGMLFPLVSIRMKKNKVIALSMGLFLTAYLLIHAFEFRIQIHSPYWPALTQIGLAILMISLPLALKEKWKYRIGLSALMACSLMFLIPKLGIWNISLNHYVKNNYLKYEEYIEQHISQLSSRIDYLACRDGELFTKPKLKEKKLNESICKSFSELDVNEVFINETNSKYLFAMHRFIDNGYGLLYSTSEFNKDKFYRERVNGLQLTSIHKIRENWYYVTFT